MDVDHTILYASCAVLNLLIGGMVLKHNINSASHRFFFLFTFTQFLWISSLYLGFYFIVPYDAEKSTFFIRLAYGFPCFMYLLLPSFFYYFPRKTFSVHPIFIWLLYGLATFWFAAASFTSLVHDSQILVDGAYVADNFGPFYQAYTWYFVGSLVLTLIIATKKIFDLQGLEKKKMIYAAIGCWVFLSLILTTNVILPFFGMYILLKESVVFSLFFLIPTFYSIQKYRFFDFGFASLSLIRHLILFIAFFVTVVVIYTIMGSIIAEEMWLRLSLSGLAGLMFYTLLNNIFPELISRGFREFRYKIDELKSIIYYCNNYQELFKKLESVFVLDLHFTSVQLYLIRSKKNHIEIPIYYKDRFSEAIEKEQLKILVADELKLQKNKFLLEFLEKLNSSICFPIYLETRLIGFFTLGQKSKHDYWSREEIEELLKAKQFIELCFINILLQSDLKEENDLMKELIHEKTKSLKKKNEKIKHLLNQQSDFIALTAHEFRTPLNIALLQLEDTLESYEHSSQVLDDMKVLESSLEKLKHLTQNLFDIQQYDLNKVKIYPKEIDLNWFIKDIFDEFQDIAAKKKLRFSLRNHLKSPTPVKIDEPKMRQVMHNLLTNASKFIPDGGQIIIEVETKGDKIHLSVIDNGPGVADKDKLRIFDKFQTTQSHMGMGIGLGLYLCKQIVELHQGSIFVQDTPKGGATLKIILPREMPEKKKKLHGRSS